MCRHLHQNHVYRLMTVGLVLGPKCAWAFHSRQMDAGFFVIGLILIFHSCLLVIGILLGVLTYLDRKGRKIKGHRQIVQALKVSPFLIAIIEYIVYVAEIKF